jgi:hypothetical protein
MFVGEMIPRNDTADKVNFFPDTKIMGCQKNCETMNSFISYLEVVVSSDFTKESDFIGSESRWCHEKIKKGEMNVIPAQLIGASDIDGKQVTIDRLMSNTFLNLSDKVQGLYLPADEILKRTAYQWFARQSAKQALQSNTVIGKYLLINRE